MGQFQEKEESESEEGEGEGANIISASCTLMENTPILITTNRDQIECDSGFEGSPDLQKNDCGRESKIDRDGESPVSFPKKTLTSPKRSSEEKKTREKQLLESFFKTENHGQGQIEDATRVTSNPAKRVTPEKKRAPGIPAGIPSRIAQEPKEAKKGKNRKPKVTTAEFKDSIMKKTYKIRFHVNLKESPRKAALCPSDFPQLLQGSQRVWEEMKPLLVLRKTSVLPWHGHTKRCMEVLILVVDQGVDPPMGVFPNNNVIHRIEIQIFCR